MKAHQNLTFTTPPNLQRAVALGLAKDDAYFRQLSASLAAKRDLLSAGLRQCGFDVLASDGSYFVTAAYAQSPLAAAMPQERGPADAAFCRHITAQAGVAAIPLSAFYESDAPQGWIRFAFCKQDAVLEEACARLGAQAQAAPVVKAAAQA